MYEVITLPTVPLGFGIATLLLAGYWESRGLKPPNKLMLVCLFVALLYAGAKSWIAPNATGGLVSALIGMLAGGTLMLPLSYWFDLGRGCVSALAAFGAWVCCSLGASIGGRVLLITGCCAMTILAANVMVHNRLPESDPEYGKPLVHGQVPVSFGALMGLLATIWM